MSESSGANYYVALVASTVSVLAWIAAGLVSLAAIYAAATGGSVRRFGTATVVAVAVAIVFARIEKRLYRLE